MSAFPRLFVACAMLLVPAAAAGAPVAAKTNATGSVALLRPLTLLKKANLDFGELVATGAGTAVIDPVSGATTVTGPLTPVGTAGHPATFTATGSKNSVVIIRIPSSALTLTNPAGGTMTVSNWTLDGKTNRRIAQNNAFDFSVGATLNVGAGQPDGIYSGTFQVTVQYP